MIMSAEAVRLARVSVWFARACLMLAAGVPLLVLAWWTLADDAALLDGADLACAAPASPLALWQRVAAGAAALAPALLLGLALVQARALFSAFAAGRAFTAGSVARVRRIAGWILAAAAAGVLATPAMSVALTLANPPGQRLLTVSLGTEDLFALMIAGVLWAMAAAMAEAVRLADDAAQIV